MDREQLVAIYFHLGLEYKEIVFVLEHDDHIIVSERHLKRILVSLGLSRWKSYAGLDEVVGHISAELIGSGALHGHKWLWQKLKDRGIYAKQETVILQVLQPESVALRARHRLQIPNFLWHCDSYDKLKTFGICINGCVDGFFLQSNVVKHMLY